jgi:hypothetical protein
MMNASTRRIEMTPKRIPFQAKEKIINRSNHFGAERIRVK